VIAVPDDALVIGLGGNVGGEPAILERFVRAREAFAQIGDVRSAPLYRTEPIGPAQPPFLNSALRVRWPRVTDRRRPASGPECDAAIASEVIATVLEIERLLGRNREEAVRWGPRLIDLDVLVWGTRVIRTPDLEVPHPRLAQRRFALRPLVDLFGDDLVLPGATQTIGMLERAVAAQGLEQVQLDW
jgi:2-amino-4-hydroxy-6-hydroxymethyldihydropteridine diphosphokinase